jgi:hypothetical protein
MAEKNRSVANRDVLIEAAILVETHIMAQLEVLSIKPNTLYLLEVPNEDAIIRTFEALAVRWAALTSDLPFYAPLIATSKGKVSISSLNADELSALGLQVIPGAMDKGTPPGAVVH